MAAGGTPWPIRGAGSAPGLQNSPWLEMLDGRLRGKVLSAVKRFLVTDEAKGSLWLNLSEESEGVNRRRFNIPGNAVFC